MKTPPKPIKITGSATGSGNQRAVNFSNTQIINKSATRTSGGINTPQVQPVYRETGITITGTATGSTAPKATNFKNYQKLGMTAKKIK